MPKVHQRGPTVRHDEQVASVKVTVEHPVKERPFQESDHAGPDDGMGVHSRLLHTDDVVEVEASQPLHHQHPFRHVIGVGSGNHEALLIQFHEHLGHVEHVGRLQPEVQLLHDGLGEQLDQRRGVGQGRHRDPPDQERGDPTQHSKVLADEGVDPRPLDLDHHLLAGPQHCGMDLGDGCRGQRHTVEGLEHLMHRPAQFGFHHLDHLLEIDGGDLIAALLALRHQLGRKHTLAGTDDLGQLDVGRAEPFGGQPDSSGKAGPGSRGAPIPQVPETESPAEDGDDRQGSAGRWYSGRPGEMGKLPGLLATEDLHHSIPRELVRGQAPRRVVGERPEMQVVRDGMRLEGDAGVEIVVDLGLGRVGHRSIRRLLVQGFVVHRSCQSGRVVRAAVGRAAKSRPARSLEVGRPLGTERLDALAIVGVTHHVAQQFQ